MPAAVGSGGCSGESGKLSECVVSVNMRVTVCASDQVVNHVASDSVI